MAGNTHDERHQKSIPVVSGKESIDVIAPCFFMHSDYQNTRRFPLSMNDIPDTPLHYLVDQLEVAVDQIHEYDWLGRNW